ncbi:MAG: CvpA family protein [Acidobacteriota bacterium]
MLSAVVAIATVLLFALIGYRKGFGLAALDLLSLLLSAIVVLLAGGPLGAALADRGVSALVAFIVAPLVLVLGIGIAFQILGLVLRRSFRGPDGKPWLRGPGALLNALTGSLYATVFVWAIMLYRGLAGTAPADPAAVERFAGRFMGGLAAAVVRATYPDEPLAPRAVGTILGRPGAGLRKVQELAVSPQLAELMQDPSFQKALDEGYPATVVAHPHFQRFLGDEELQGTLTDLGLAGDGLSPEESATLREHLARNMIYARQRLRALESNPEARAILAKPEVRQLLEERDVVKLLKNKDMLRLVELVMEPSAS